MDAIDSCAERPDQVVYLGLSTVFGPSAAPEGLFTVKADVAEVLSGALSGWPGVGAQCCVSVRRKMRLAASYSPCACTRGVPAWLYQRLN